jgi:amidase
MISQTVVIRLTSEAQLHYKRDKFRYAYLQQWREKNIDVLLSPAYTGVAARHDTARYWA